MSATTALARAIVARADEGRIVVFPVRAKVVKSDVGNRRIFESRCGRYRIVETVYSCKALVARWYAMKRDEFGWTYVERFRQWHTKRATCVAAIEADALALAAKKSD